MPPRARDYGLPFAGTPGPLNAITDVTGVSVGFTTLTDPARGLRTGVTAILPRPADAPLRPVLAGHFSLNGNGEMTGTHWIDDAGYMAGPVLITNTHAVGACHAGAVRWMIDRHPTHFRDGHAWAMPVVAETYDGVLNDITTLAVTPDHAIAALEAAKGGPVAEGSTGGGNGMIAYGFKGGTGTASRRVTIGADYTLGVLVQANHGRREWLTVLGRSPGLAPDPAAPHHEMGSVIVLLATDAPLSPLSLRALAKRAALGIGRGGTPGGNSSGDIFLALSTADAGPMPQDAGPLLPPMAFLNPEWIDPLYLATVEAVEEAVLNALSAGETVQAVKPPGRIVPALDMAQVARIFARG